MKWSFAAVALVLLPVVILVLVERPLPHEAREIWLPWAGIMAAVALLVHTAFRCLHALGNVTLKVLGMLGGMAAAVLAAYIAVRLDDLLVRLPVAAQGVLAAVYAALLARGIVVAGEGRFQFGLGTVLAVMAALGVVLGSYRWMAAHYGPIPFDYTWVRTGDVDGMATIETDRLVVQFEGHSFGPHVTGGAYAVDGRYNVLIQPEARILRQSNGVGCGYSMQERLLTIEYQGHRLTYSHPTSTVRFDGREFSVADSSLRLLVRRDGRVVAERLEETLEEGRQRARRPQRAAAGVRPGAGCANGTPRTDGNGSD